MNITKEQIKGEAKIIGALKGAPVYLLVTKGGLNIVLVKNSTGTKALSTAPHRAIAKASAREEEPEIEFNELTKSEEFDLQSFKHILPEYKELTQRINELI